MELPAWLAFALISPLFFAVVHVLDAYCVADVFDRPWVGVVTSGATVLAALPLLVSVLLVVGWRPVAPDVVGLCVLAGALYMCGQVLYFQALGQSESGIVAAYWNLTPVLVAVVSYSFLGEQLEPRQYAGAVFLVGAATLFSLLDANRAARWRSLALMVAACSIITVYFLLQKRILAACPAYQAFVLTCVGMAATGLSLLLLPGCRRVVHGNLPRLRPAVRFLLVIEVANTAAVLTSQFAIDRGSPSLVAAVEAAIPAYTFGLSVGLWVLTRRYGEEEARNRLWSKLALVAVMASGVRLVS